MEKLCADYFENLAKIDSELHVDENFDLIKKKLCIGEDELTLYFIDGFIKDAVMQKLMTHFLSVSSLPNSAQTFADSHVPYVEVDVSDSFDQIILMLLSGAAIVFGSRFGCEAIIIDARTYPARTTDEPGNDRVMRGSHDGFVETLIFNTALIRRRIRDTNLKMVYRSIGSSSKTDIAICYIDEKADKRLLEQILLKLDAIKTDALNLGHQSLAECLIEDKWYNPFPKIRYTERPDVASAQLLEGGIIILCDNSPEAMIFPTSIFDFLQETNDYYFPPVTGTYIRIVRNVTFFSTLFITPLWYLFIKNPSLAPAWLSFIIPTEEAKIPLIAQLLLVEFMIDILKLASMNTPSMLSNSLSVIGGLILGDFAVEAGWVLPEVILYMAFISMGNFSQPSYELGYAFKFVRILLLLLTSIFNIWGFIIGLTVFVLLLATNKTVGGKRRYLFPVIPFNAKALCHLLFRVSKSVNDNIKKPS